ncbi:hypothetical protein [Peptostreptococcus sp. D1]|uniref:hypothetical protein n=1 Tax=Peptostreptococcus sp. D1 TaxID=72304 RepID=UPI0008F26605|nr:hypothetical protein [Peptostreptococcus sp. D1]SFE88322.1 hypothetical protein SAMN02910278_01960 [Peptostreptococcus sp. D1]
MTRKESLLEFLEWAIDDNVGIEVQRRGMHANFKEVIKAKDLAEYKMSVVKNYNDDLKHSGIVYGSIVGWKIKE